MYRPFERFEDTCMHRLASCKVILDVGGGTRFMKGMKTYEPLFQDCEYKTLDVSADYTPDIVGDIHAMPIADASIDGIVCRSVLEHVERPHVAVKEMYRILKPGGLLFIQVPSTYPYHARHGFGAYPDYWRYFEDSLRLVCADFRNVTLQKHGGWFAAMSNFVPGQVHLRWALDPLSYACDTVFRTDRKTTTPFYTVLAEK